MGSSHRRLFIGGGLLLGLLAAAYLLPIQSWLTAALDYAQGLGGWGPLLLAAFYVLSCVLFLPGSALTLGAGAVFGLFWGFIAVSVGSVLGATAAFAIGRTLARGWVERRIAGHARFAALDAAVAREGFKIVLLTRLSPVFPFNLLNFAFGVTRVSLRDYVLGSWLGMIPGTLMYVYIGTAAKSVADIASGQAQGGTVHQILLGVGLIATIAVTVLVTRIARKALNDAIEPA